MHCVSLIITEICICWKVWSMTVAVLLMWLSVRVVNSKDETCICGKVWCMTVVDVTVRQGGEQQGRGGGVTFVCRMQGTDATLHAVIYCSANVNCSLLTLFSFNLFIFPSVLWHCWLGNRKGIRPVKKNLGVGLLVVMIWLGLCTTYGSSSPVVTTHHLHHPSLQ